MPARSLYEATVECLRNGRWEARPNGERSLEKMYNPAFKFACKAQMQRLQRSQWKPDDPSCSSFLELDPLTARFDGLFADRGNPVAFHVVAESIAQTVDDALSDVIKANPNLSGLIGTLGVEVNPKSLSRLMNPINIAAIPSLNGTLRVLNSLNWSSTVQTRRFILTMSANWYNLLSKGDDHDRRALPNHDEPWSTPCLDARGQARVCSPPMRKKGHNWVGCSSDGCLYGNVQWGWYPWVRRAEGSLTAVEYIRDLRILATAASLHREANVVWVEPLPQHCSAECDRALQTRNKNESCSPWPYFGPNGTHHHMSPATLQLVCPHLDGGTHNLDGCEANISRWRYQLSESVLRRSNMPVVPLEKALSPRWEMHTDCTHWVRAQWMLEPADAVPSPRTHSPFMSLRAVLTE